MHDAGVVEEHVQAAELALGGGDHLLAIARLRHVRPAGRRLAALVSDLGYGVGGGLLVHVDREDRRAFLREEQRRLPADAASRARDERNLVFESHMRSKYLLRSQSVTALS